MKKNHAWVPRQAFVETRFENWKKKKKFIAETGMEDHVVLSDLEKPVAPGGKLLRDVVLCDGCNEDIEEEKFLMVEKQLCYHRQCALHRGMIEASDGPIEELPPNVISIAAWLAKADE